MRLYASLWAILVTVVTIGLLASGCTGAAVGSEALPVALPVAERPAAPEEPQSVAPPEPQFITAHIVQPGETLTKIAIQYGTRVDAIQDANNMGNRTMIRVGDTLVVPSSNYQDQLRIYKDAVDRYVTAVAKEAAEATALLAEEMDHRRELAEAERETLGTRSERWMIVAFAVLSLTMLVAARISYYLYRWRELLADGPERWVALSEKLGGYMESLGDNVTNLKGGAGDHLHRLHERTEQLSEQVGNMVKTFMTLRKAVDVRDDEITSLKLGYDAQIFGRFLRRFVRVDRAVQGFLGDEGREAESLMLAKDLLKDALDECGVEPFEPGVGEDYRAMGDQVADNPKEIPTTDPDQDFQVAEIVERGYRLRGADDSWQIVVPAKVRIYKYQN